MNTDKHDVNATIAVFLDLENIAIGAQEAHFPRFDIQKILERLLLKGHIVVKKAYWTSTATRSSSGTCTRRPSS